MQKRLILDPNLLDITLNRLCQHLIEVHDDFSDSVIIGLQPRGKYLAKEIHSRLSNEVKKKIHQNFRSAMAAGRSSSTRLRDPLRTHPKSDDTLFQQI